MVSRNNFLVPEIVIYYSRRDEKSVIIIALTYTAVKIINVKRTIEKNC